MHIQELARRLGAVVDEAADVEITAAATIDEAGASDLAFLANPRYENALESSAAGAVLVDTAYAGTTSAIRLVHENPYLAFARALTELHTPPTPPTGIHPTAVIGEDVEIGDGVSIGAYVVVGDRVRIADRVTIHPHVVIYADAELGEGVLLHSHTAVRERVRLGKGVIVQNGTVIGADGFGFAPRGDGSYEKIPQTGTVTIEEDVEVQANSSIDRAAVGATTVGRGTKIDNMVQIGHGCHVGENVLLCGQVGLAGSTDLGDRVILAGQVGIAGHLRLADDVILSAQSGVGHSIREKGIYGGSPAIPMSVYRKCVVHTAKQPETAKRLKDLLRRVEKLEGD